MDPTEKPLVWLKGEVKTPPFSTEARVEAGVLLRRVQRGEKLSLKMPSSFWKCSIRRRLGHLRGSWRTAGADFGHTGLLARRS